MSCSTSVTAQREVKSQLIPIGRFARSCRLTIKALRHYDEADVLAPAHVDATTGYRYYARSQAQSALLIGMLRSLDFSLPTIRAVLAAPRASRRGLIEAELERQRRELVRRQVAIAVVERLAESADLIPYPVEVRTLDPWLVATRGLRTSEERLIPDTTALIYGLFDALKQAGRKVLAPVGSVIEDAAGGEAMLLEAFAGVQAPAPSLSGVRIRELEGGTFAHTTHVGSYDQVGLAYQSLYLWLHDHGHEPAGPIREVYDNDPAETPEGELVTHVMMAFR